LFAASFAFCRAPATAPAARICSKLSELEGGIASMEALIWGGASGVTFAAFVAVISGARCGVTFASVVAAICGGGCNVVFATFVAAI
jgi:3-oxoacyl-ACP reductase-like protein